MRMRMRRGRGRVRKRVRFVRFQRRRVGRRVGTNVCKSADLTAFSNMQPFQTRVMYGKEITQIAEGGGINQRERAIVNLRGLRVRCQFKSNHDGAGTGTNASVPLLCNIALIGAKTLDGITSGDDIDSNFFRSIGAAGRYISFSNSGINSNYRHTTPINNDKFIVLWHLRFKLGTINQNGGFSSGEFKNYRTLARYVKIGRQIRYTGTAATTCQDRLWVIWWFGGLEETDGNFTSAQPACTASLRFYPVFKDPRV